MAWLSRTKSSSSGLPIRSPTLDFGTAVMLSSISREEERGPLRSSGSIGNRNRDASVGSLMKTQIAIESVASKAPSCTMTTGRGLPA